MSKSTSESKDLSKGAPNCSVQPTLDLSSPNCSSSSSVRLPLEPRNINGICLSLQKSFSVDSTACPPQQSAVSVDPTTVCPLIKPGKFKYKSKLKESPTKLKKVTFKKKCGEKTLANRKLKNLKFSENKLNAVAQQLESLSMKPSEAQKSVEKCEKSTKKANLKIDHSMDYEMLDLNSLMSNCLHIPKQMSAMASAMYG